MNLTNLLKLQKYSVDTLTLSSDTANVTYQIKFEKLWCTVLVLQGQVQMQGFSLCLASTVIGTNDTPVFCSSMCSA